MADAIIRVVENRVVVQVAGSELLTPLVVSASESAAQAEAARVETAAAAAIVEAVTPRVGALETVAGVSGPGLGFIPGTALVIDSARLDAVGRAISLNAVPGGDYVPDASGAFALAIPEALALDGDGPSLGFLPDTPETILRAVLDRATGGALQLIGDGSETGFVTVLTQTPFGLRASAGAGGGGSTDPDAEPVVFDAAGTTLLVPSASGEIGGGRIITWPATTVTSAATTSDVVTDFAITAGVNYETLLEHEEILSVQQMRRASDNAARTLGTHYTVNLTRGTVTNLTADALKLDYTGSRQKKGIVTVDVSSPVPVLTESAQKKRNASLYTPACPAGSVIIGHTLRKGSHFWFIPNHDFFDGVKRTDWPKVIQETERNRRILAPIRSALAGNRPITVIINGNSRAMFGGGDPGANDLNTKPNSSYNDYARDGFFFNNMDNAADRAALKMVVGGSGGTDANLANLDLVPGFNLTGGTPDGYGKTHVLGSYAWTLIKGLHDASPLCPIRVFNFSIYGTASGTGTVGGMSNVLQPDRRDAVLAKITAEVALGNTVMVIPIDGVNDVGDPAFYANLVSFNALAYAAGASAIHHMGLNRPDARYGGNQDSAVALIQQEMTRAAWDTNAAVTDSWPVIGPVSLRGTGLHEDENMAADAAKHDHPFIHVALGRHALRSYL